MDFSHYKNSFLLNSDSGFESFSSLKFEDREIFAFWSIPIFQIGKRVILII